MRLSIPDLNVVTQHSVPEERCVTTLKTAVQQNTQLAYLFLAYKRPNCKQRKRPLERVEVSYL